MIYLSTTDDLSAHKIKKLMEEHLNLARIEQHKLELEFRYKTSLEHYSKLLQANIKDKNFEAYHWKLEKQYYGLN